jgi:hypothetical protein
MWTLTVPEGIVLIGTANMEHTIVRVITSGHMRSRLPRSIGALLYARRYFLVESSLLDILENRRLPETQG